MEEQAERFNPAEDEPPEEVRLDSIGRKITAGRTKGLLKGGNPWGRGGKPKAFCDPKEFPKQDGTEVEIYRWVFANMYVVEPDKSNCPGPGAWGYLWECRQDQSARSEFYKLHSKLLPNKTQMNQGNPYEDDGQGILKLISDVERGLVQVDPARSAGVAS